jgi:hypothetical protein
MTGPEFQLWARRYLQVSSLTLGDVAKARKKYLLLSPPIFASSHTGCGKRWVERQSGKKLSRPLHRHDVHWPSFDNGEHVIGPSVESLLSFR